MAFVGMFRNVTVRDLLSIINGWISKGWWWLKLTDTASVMNCHLHHYRALSKHTSNSLSTEILPKALVCTKCVKTLVCLQKG